MLKRITQFSKAEMKKICEKACVCSNCPLNTYVGCFYSFKLSGYLDLLIDAKTLKRYAETDKSE